MSQISVEEAVSREDIQVVFICTENVLHENDVRYCVRQTTAKKSLHAISVACETLVKEFRTVLAHWS